MDISIKKGPKKKKKPPENLKQECYIWKNELKDKMSNKAGPKNRDVSETSLPNDLTRVRGRLFFVLSFFSEDRERKMEKEQLNVREWLFFK